MMGVRAVFASLPSETLLIVHRLYKRFCFAGSVPKGLSPKKIFGANLRSFRLDKHLTQEQLAELSELDPTYISGLESGARNPTLLTITKLARALGVQISQLVAGC
jgi:DNA-binding XRE family transcriptional regulator